MATRALVTLYTDYTAAGGRRIGDLTLAGDGGTVGYQLDQSGTGTIPVDSARWLALGGALRMVARVTWPEGIVEEYRIARVTAEDGDPVTVLTVLPVFDDLATCGPILQVVGSQVVTRLAGELAVSTWLATYFTPHAGVTRLGIVVGTLEHDPIVPLDLDAPTPRALLDALTSKEGFEWELVRTSDTVWTLHGWKTRGAALAAFTVREGVNQLALVAGVDDSQLVTVAIPLGATDPDTGDRATMATTRYVVTSITGDWVVLQDRDADASPILVDTQWVGAAVLSRFGFASAILDSRTSDGAVQLASTTGLAVGDRVWIAADAFGAPCTEVWDTTSLTAQGRRAKPLRDDTMRGEANEVPNGRFTPDMTGWTQANGTTPPAYAEVKRTELGRTVTAAANGARAAATGTGTPFAIDGLVPLSYVRQWAELRTGGATCAVSADAVPDATGALALSISPGLPGDYADDTPLTLVRGDARTLLLDGAQSPLMPYLIFQDSNTDHLLSATQAGVTGTLAAASGGYTSAVASPIYEFDANGVRAGKLIVRTSVAPYTPSPLTWPSVATDTYTITLTGYTALSSTTARFTWNASSGSPTTGTWFRYYSQSGEWVVVEVTGTGAGYLDVTVRSRDTVLYWESSAFTAIATDVLLANGSSWTFTQLRESRTVRLSSAHIAGATTVNTKAQSVIARRTWTGTDTLELRRALTGTLAMTGIVSTVGYTDEDGNPIIGMSAEVSITAGSSTMDDYTLGSDWSLGEVVFVIDGTPWRFEGMSGGNAILSNAATWDTPTPFTVPQTVSASWTHYDTYALTGTANWGANGRVTLSLASAVPAGRSYARGEPVWANWHTRAGFGLNTLLRLHAALNATDTTVQLGGQDAYVASSDPTAALAVTCYRVPSSASTLPIPGNTLYAASTVQADATGAASVTLVAANPNAIANNETVTIVTPDLLRPTDPTDGYVVRLCSPVGGSNIPTGSTPGLDQLQRIPITVPTGQTVTVTAFVTVALSTGTYPLGQQPAVALVDAAGAVLTYARLADGSVQVVQTPTVARLIVSHTLTTSTSVGVRVFGGATDKALWQAVLDVMWCVTTRDDVPFVQDAWGNQLARRGADVLAVYRWPYATVRVELGVLRRWFEAPATQAPIALGQPVVIPAYGITRRVLSYVRALADPSRIECEIGTVPTDQSRRVAGILTGS